MGDSLQEFVERAKSTFRATNVFVVKLEEQLRVEPCAYEAVKAECRLFIRQHTGWSPAIDTSEWPDMWRNLLRSEFFTVFLFYGDPEQIHALMRVTHLPSLFDHPLQLMSREAVLQLRHHLLPELLKLVFGCDTSVKRRRCREALLDACIEYSELAGIDSWPLPASNTEQCESTSEPATPTGEGESVDKRSVRSSSRPPEKAFQAWRLRDLKGWKQKRIAQELGTNQGQVSRWIAGVSEYLKAGNVLPNLKVMDKPESVSPCVLDMGARRDGRTPRQRDEWSDDSID